MVDLGLIARLFKAPERLALDAESFALFLERHDVARVLRRFFVVGWI